jgi:hypothetical protein
MKFTGFTDWPKLKASFKRAGNGVLKKAGAFVRTRAKSSIRKRKRSAVPGQPPSSHTGRLRDLIFFVVEEAIGSVVIGPLLFRQQTPTVPKLLELGGTVEKQWRTGKPATYHKFPYMEPALEAERPKFPELFTDSVK